MDEHTATEQAYKNGYEQGQRDAVKHGRWERNELFAPYCTVCESSPMSALRPEGNYRYCPNCGAKMDGGADDGNL